MLEYQRKSGRVEIWPNACRKFSVWPDLDRSVDTADFWSRDQLLTRNQLATQSVGLARDQSAFWREEDGQKKSLQERQNGGCEIKLHLSHLPPLPWFSPRFFYFDNTRAPRIHSLVWELFIIFPSFMPQPTWDGWRGDGRQRRGSHDQLLYDRQRASLVWKRSVGRQMAHLTAVRPSRRSTAAPLTIWRRPSTTKPISPYGGNFWPTDDGMDYPVV